MRPLQVENDTKVTDLANEANKRKGGICPTDMVKYSKMIDLQVCNV